VTSSARYNRPEVAQKANAISVGIPRRIGGVGASNSAAEGETSGRSLALAIETELVAACIGGDRDAQRRLYDTYQDSIYRLVVRMVGPQEAADVTQQVFLQAFRNLGHFAGRSSLLTWLHRVALNECWQHFRRERRRKWHVLEHEPMDDAPGQERNADDRELLEQALARLEPDLRAVFVLREVESRSYREMAEILGISDGTVASRLNRARRLLRDYLIDMGWDP